jgi:hypothetical protein
MARLPLLRKRVHRWDVTFRRGIAQLVRYQVQLGRQEANRSRPLEGVLACAAPRRVGPPAPLLVEADGGLALKDT